MKIERVEKVYEVIDTAFRPKLLGRHAAETEHLWKVMHGSLLGPDARAHEWRKRTVLSAIAAVDLALRDIKAKAAGLLICRLLGGKRGGVRAYWPPRPRRRSTCG